MGMMRKIYCSSYCKGFWIRMIEVEVLRCDILDIFWTGLLVN